MPKYIRISIETGLVGGDSVEIIEVPDNYTEEDMAEEAREHFFNKCSYGWSECDENGND